MKTARTVTIKSVSEDLQDKNNRTYRKVTVATADKIRVFDEDTQKEVLTAANARTAVITSYEKSYLNNESDRLWDLPEETVLLGDIITMAVEAYAIEERMVNKYTTVVLGDSSDANTWLFNIFSTFRSNGHRCLGDSTPENVDPETGEIKQSEPDPSAKMDLNEAAKNTKKEAIATTKDENLKEEAKKPEKAF